MHSLLKIVAGLVVGAVVFGLATVGVTELFSPRIEFSLFVGIPVGAWMGIAAGALTVTSLWYHDAAPASRAAPWLTRSLWATLAVAVDVGLLSALGIGWYFLLDGGPDALGLLIVGIPVTMIGAALLGFVLAPARDGGEPADLDADPTAR